jgi:monoterpene epsilon-lactone hydrolase
MQLSDKVKAFRCGATHHFAHPCSLKGTMHSLTRTPVLRALLPAPLLLCCSLTVAALPQSQITATPPPGSQTNTSVVSADGTAHITRVVPLPSVLSPEAIKAYRHPGTDAPNMDPDILRRRAATQAGQNEAGKRAQQVYPVKITESSFAGVPVHIVDPLPEARVGPVEGAGSGGNPLQYSVLQPTLHEIDQMCAIKKEPVHVDRVLLCVHGGGFLSDSGSYSESIPIANLTRTRVVSVLYRLAPEHPYPAGLDDAIAVYKHLLKTYPAKKIAVFGTSAGAVLTGEIGARIKQLGLPQPAALGIFSGFGDFTQLGDSASLFTLFGYTGPLPLPADLAQSEGYMLDYVGSTNPRDPVLSPNFGDLHGLAPTLFVTSSRDVFQSGISDMERAWLRDGVPSQMVAFDGLPHAFWLNVDLPESREAFATMASFFNRELAR